MQTLIMPESLWLLFLFSWLVGLGAGLLSGFVAGIAGVGGGLIYVPVFFFLLPSGDTGVAIHIMFSLMAVMLTGALSARSHWQLGHVDRAICQRLLPGLVIGASLGLWITLSIPDGWVLLMLASLELWVAWDLGRDVRTQKASNIMLWSLPIGGVSGLLGIGGGTMMVPLLRRSKSLRIAVGSSAACGALMAAGSVIVNMLGDQQWRTLWLDNGVVGIMALLGVAMAVPFSTQWAATMHLKYSEGEVRFALRCLYLSLAMALSLGAAIAFFSADTH